MNISRKFTSTGIFSNYFFKFFNNLVEAYKQARDVFIVVAEIMHELFCKKKEWNEFGANQSVQEAKSIVG